MQDLDTLTISNFGLNSLSSAALPSANHTITAIHAVAQSHLMTNFHADWDLSFYELVKRIRKTPEERLQLDNNLAACEGMDSQALDLLEILRTGDFCHPALKTDKLDSMAWLALYGVMKHLISLSEYGSLMNLRVILQSTDRGSEDSEPTFVPLFKNDKPNPDARYLLEGMNDCLFGQTKFLDSIEIIFDLAKRLSPTQQHIIMFPDRHPMRPNLPRTDSSRTITQRLAEQGFSFFSGIHKHEMKVSVPPALIQEIMNFRNPEDSTSINYVLGYSNDGNFVNNGLNKNREVQLAAPGFPYKTSADGFIAFETEFFEHDVFHLNLSNNISKIHQQAIIWVGQLARHFQDNDEDVKKLSHQFYKHCIDLQFGNIDKLDLPENFKFWHYMADTKICTALLIQREFTPFYYVNSPEIRIRVGTLRQKLKTVYLHLFSELLKTYSGELLERGIHLEALEAYAQHEKRSKSENVNLENLIEALSLATSRQS